MALLVAGPGLAPTEFCEILEDLYADEPFAKLAVGLRGH